MNRILCASLVFALCVCAAAAQQEADFQTDGDGTITLYNGSDKDVVIPATIDGKPVTAIGDFAFSFNELTSVTIPDSLTVIGEGAFLANELTSVTIPAGVTSIGEGAFSSNKLTTVTIPDSLTVIGEGAFFNNELTSVTIPAGVTAIGYIAFAFNSRLKEILCDAENPVYTSADGVLFSKDGKILVAYPGGKGTTYTIPDGVTAIGEYAFAHNELTSVTIPNSVTAIGESAFAHNKLTSVTISAGVTHIGSGAFAANSWLKEILCDTGNPVYTSADGVLFSKDGKILVAYPDGKGTVYDIPDGVVIIGNFTFHNTELTRITIPAGVTTIGDSAFENNYLTSVTRPESVTVIGDSAFARNRLISVTIGSNVAMADGAFDDDFARLYNDNGKQAGTYVLRDGAWEFRE
jgi:WD40 repeat protein